MNELTVIEKNENSALVPTGATMADRLLIAAQSGLSLDVLERFMALAERQEKRDAEKAFHKAFAAFKANPPKIVKDKLVKYGNTNYQHATIGKVVGAIIEGMSIHGLSHRWNVKQDADTITVTCYITHELGHTEETSISAGADQSGGKNAIQAIASTVTYLERYTLQAATGIAVLEDDDDGRGAENISHPPPGKKQGKSDKGNTPQKEQKYLDGMLDWVDKFTDSTLDMFISQWEVHGVKAMAAMPKEHADKLMIAKREMEKHLTEKETKNAK